MTVIPNPDGESDQVWVVVERNGVKYIEYFNSSIVDSTTDQGSLFYVDSGVS